MAEKGPGIAADWDYILPARTLHGPATEKLAAIDEVVEGLLALRQRIAIGVSVRQTPS